MKTTLKWINKMAITSLNIGLINLQHSGVAVASLVQHVAELQSDSNNANFKARPVNLAIDTKSAVRNSGEFIIMF